jgi:hypothetical protein
MGEEKPDLSQLVPPGMRVYFTPQYPERGGSAEHVELTRDTSVVMHADTYPYALPPSQVYVIRDNSGAPYVSMSTDNVLMNGTPLVEYLRTRMSGVASFNDNTNEHMSDERTPFIVHKYGAYLPVADDTAYVPPKLTRLRRVMCWWADTQYKIRVRLASMIMGYNVEDHDS